MGQVVYLIWPGGFSIAKSLFNLFMPLHLFLPMVTATQPLLALIFVFLGFCFGIFFDIYRVVHQMSNPGKWITALCDLSFWVCYTAWVYIVLLRLNAGEVRAFLFVALLIGLAFYFIYFSRPLLKAWFLLFTGLIALAKWCNGVVNTILSFILAILAWPYRLIQKLMTFIGWLCSPLFWLLQAGRGLAFSAGYKLRTHAAKKGSACKELLLKLWKKPPVDE